MKKMLCVWMMLVAGAVCAQTVFQDVPDATVVGPSNDPFLFSVIRGNAAYGTNALAVANAAKTTAVNASNRIVFAEGTINALVSTQRVVVAQMGALVSTQAVQSVTISNAFSLGMAALVKANDVSELIGSHNLSAFAHTDIRASVSNAVDMATGAVKTNAVGGLAIGEESTATGAYSSSRGLNSNASGIYSSAYGNFCYATAYGASAWGGTSIAKGMFAFAFGISCTASGNYSQAFGVGANSGQDFSFTWSGGGGYSSHGEGTFNVNPVGGLLGFYIGETHLQSLFDEKLSTDHENEASAHNGRITALENRPTGLTTNTVFPFMMLSDDYSTNGVIRVAVSNGVFSIWGMK